MSDAPPNPAQSANVQLASPQAKEWQPTLLIKISVILHAALLVCLLASPQLWRWLLVIFIADHLVITIVGLLPDCPDH